MSALGGKWTSRGHVPAGDLLGPKWLLIGECPR
jgi:hypothetical protein